MVSFTHRWPVELDALPLLPTLPTLTPTAHVLRHLRTVLFGATQNGEHLTTLVARPSATTETPSSFSPQIEHRGASQRVNLLIDGFAHNLSHNTLPIPVYAQLSEQPPVLKYLPPGDTALTAFPIAAACRLNGTDLEVTFSTRIPDIHFYAFKEQALSETDVRLSENSLSILLRTELSNGHGLLEQRSSTTMSVQPVRMRDTTSITRVAGAWYAGNNEEYTAAITSLGRHLARKRNRRIAPPPSPSSSSPATPVVAKAIILHFDSSVRVRWMYVLARPTTVKWICVCQGNRAAGVPISFQVSDQVSSTDIPERHVNDRHGKSHPAPRQSNFRRETPRSSRRGSGKRRISIERSSVVRGIPSSSRIQQDSDEPKKEESFMTEKMTELKFDDAVVEEVKTASSNMRLPLSVRIRKSEVDAEGTDMSDEVSLALEFTNTSLEDTVLSSVYNDDESIIADCVASISMWITVKK
ncbi:hypothetical protein FGB62_5g39 [Gracilaria domingensis]|nr:hypothetical protein FGB62_5g39 [Gracilaria domingensis]